MPPKKPSHFPPLPAHHVYLGKGGEFKLPTTFNGLPVRFEGAFFRERGASWEQGSSIAGDYRDCFYCAPIDSEVVSLNGGANKRKSEAQIVPIVFPSTPNPQKYYGFLSSKNGEKGFIVGVGYQSQKYRLVCPSLMTTGNGWSGFIDPLVRWGEIKNLLPCAKWYEFPTFRALTAWLNKVK